VRRNSCLHHTFSAYKSMEAIGVSGAVSGPNDSSNESVAKRNININLLNPREFTEATRRRIERLIVRPDDEAIVKAGVIVFREWNGSYQTITVKGSRTGNWSFPKGKRKRGEPVIDTAWRELQEETGLDANDVNLLQLSYIDEEAKHGKIRYFIALLRRKAPFFKYTATEIMEVKWMLVNNHMPLSTARKKVLQQATAKLQEFTESSSYADEPVIVGYELVDHYPRAGLTQGFVKYKSKL